MAVMPVQKPGKSKQDYPTPKVFLDAVKAFLGIKRFEHDFAASAKNTVAHTYYDEEMDALTFDRIAWYSAVHPGWGWLNPPYARIEPWAKRCHQLAEDGGKIAFLVPAAVGSNWFRDYCYQSAWVLLLNGRISFDGKAPYPKDCILCLFGHENVGIDVWQWGM